MLLSSTCVDKEFTAMKRIAASLYNLFRAVGRLAEGTIGSNGTGRALLATWGPVSIDAPRRYR
jgi:hypothetical protein